MNKKLVIIAMIVGLGAVVAAGFYFNNERNSHQSTEKEQKPFAVEKKELDSIEVPRGFPADFPVEAGSRVLKNYEASTSDGRIQSTRSSTTSKTLAAAVKTYTDYFSELGWTEIETQSPDVNSINSLMRRKDNLLTIVAKNNPATQEKIVEVTLTEAAVNNLK